MNLVLVTEEVHGFPTGIVPEEIEARGGKDEGEEEEGVDEGGG